MGSSDLTIGSRRVFKLPKFYEVLAWNERQRRGLIAGTFELFLNFEG